MSKAGEKIIEGLQQAKAHMELRAEIARLIVDAYEVMSATEAADRILAIPAIADALRLKPIAPMSLRAERKQ